MRFTIAALALVLAVPALSAQQMTAAAAPPKDIVAVAAENGNFTILAKALTAAGLVETLQGPGPFTVFAPTDSAFNKLPAGELDSLLADIPRLRELLTYHVVAGKVESKDVVNLSTATTVQGSPLAIHVMDGKVMINEATVTTPDVQASNGVIHVIDTVIMPKKN